MKYSADYIDEAKFWLEKANAAFHYDSSGDEIYFLEKAISEIQKAIELAKEGN